MSVHLVTGGAGFIGSALVRRLVRDGHHVRVLDDASRGRPARLRDVARDVELVPGDVRDPDAVRRACEGVEVIWHLAAVNGTAFFYSMPERVLEVGLKGILNVLDAARAHGIRRLFVASSSEVYQSPPKVPTDEAVPLSIPDPLNPRYSYAASKLASEMLALNYGRAGFDQVVVMRPHNVYGPDMGWEHVIPELALRARELARATTGRLSLPIEGSGDETRAFAYIDDVVDALALLEARGAHLSIYHVGTEVETRIADLAALIGRCFGREVELVPGQAKAGGTPRRCPDIGKLRALGYEPRVALAEGVAGTVRWYDEHADERPGAAGVTGSVAR